MKTIVLTGPESTGKSSLASDLSKSLDYPVLKEYARTYLEENGNDYTFEDVEIMAKEQWRQEQAITNEYDQKCILDTDLTVFYIWFNNSYQTVPDWILEIIKEGTEKLYLLCGIDIEWTADDLREHPNPADRQMLFKAYINLLDAHQLNYHIVTGNRTARLKKTLEIISNQ